jgi:hypothetical protein
MNIFRKARCGSLDIGNSGTISTCDHVKLDDVPLQHIMAAGWNDRHEENLMMRLVECTKRSYGSMLLTENGQRLLRILTY